ncbi:MAG: crossover junction endodeoxyribonuclease RuvC [Thermodesulfobacteriota bacterium]
MRILGIDPGSRATGYGIVEQSCGGLRFIACGVIRPPCGGGLPERLRVIHGGLEEVIATHRPAVAAIEEVFVSVNPRSALILGHARGVAMLAAIGSGLAVHEYSARIVKQSVVGYGQAAKGQVQQMVRVLLSLLSPPSSDAADALAIAICHAHRHPHVPSGGRPR